MFDDLLQSPTLRLTKQEIRLRQPQDPGLKLAITLWYHATGNSYHSLTYSFQVPHNTISHFVKDMCEAIVAEYQQEVFNFPTTLDGKHIAIRDPKNPGRVYKDFFAIILLGLVDGRLQIPLCPH